MAHLGPPTPGSATDSCVSVSWWLPPPGLSFPFCKARGLGQLTPDGPSSCDPVNDLFFLLCEARELSLPAPPWAGQLATPGEGLPRAGAPTGLFHLQPSPPTSWLWPCQG